MIIVEPKKLGKPKAPKIKPVPTCYMRRPFMTRTGKVTDPVVVCRKKV